MYSTFKQISIFLLLGYAYCNPVYGDEDDMENIETNMPMVMIPNSWTEYESMSLGSSSSSESQEHKEHHNHYHHHSASESHENHYKQPTQQVPITKHHIHTHNHIVHQVQAPNHPQVIKIEQPVKNDENDNNDKNKPSKNDLSSSSRKRKREVSSNGLDRGRGPGTSDSSPRKRIKEQIIGIYRSEGQLIASPTEENFKSEETDSESIERYSDQQIIDRLLQNYDSRKKETARTPKKAEPRRGSIKVTGSKRNDEQSEEGTTETSYTDQDIIDHILKNLQNPEILLKSKKNVEKSGTSFSRRLAEPNKRIKEFQRKIEAPNKELEEDLPELPGTETFVSTGVEVSSNEDDGSSAEIDNPKRVKRGVGSENRLPRQILVPNFFENIVYVPEQPDPNRDIYLQQQPLIPQDNIITNLPLFVPDSQEPYNLVLAEPAQRTPTQQDNPNVAYVLNQEGRLPQNIPKQQLPTASQPEVLYVRYNKPKVVFRQDSRVLTQDQERFRQNVPKQQLQRTTASQPEIVYVRYNNNPKNYSRKEIIFTKPLTESRRPQPSKNVNTLRYRNFQNDTRKQQNDSNEEETNKNDDSSNEDLKSQETKVTEETRNEDVESNVPVNFLNKFEFFRSLNKVFKDEQYSEEE